VQPEVRLVPARRVVATADERLLAAAAHVPVALLQRAAAHALAALLQRAVLVAQRVPAVSPRLVAVRHAPVDAPRREAARAAAWVALQRAVAGQAAQASAGAAPARQPEVSQALRPVASVAPHPAFQVQRPGLVQCAAE
jgi:hypothetical protein